MIGTIKKESIKMIKTYIENANFEDTGFSYNIITHIWKA